MPKVGAHTEPSQKSNKELYTKKVNTSKLIGWLLLQKVLS